jgi:ribosomal protein S18 acetylase RimI-like enzyme
MLDSAEADCRAKNARLLLIETSSTPGYEATRRFYLKHGYTVTAQIADFYSDGDDKVIFAKRLAAPSSNSA